MNKYTLHLYHEEGSKVNMFLEHHSVRPYCTTENKNHLIGQRIYLRYI